MSLREGDLKDMMHDVFEIDSFASKMGADKDIITISFSLKEKAPADDLMEFLEKGYGFILDADVTSGEQRDGTYKVFVEIERNRDAHENILEIVDGVKKLSAIDKLKFRYYKSFRSRPVDQTTIEQLVPTDPDNYGIKVNENNLDNYKNFFNRSFVDDISLVENTLTIKKIYSDPVMFEFIDFGNNRTIQNTINETHNVNDFSEIIFLCKYIGDYNINKYGDKIVLENEDKSLVLKRIII